LTEQTNLEQALEAAHHHICSKHIHF